jgi:hypothetical protein
MGTTITHLALSHTREQGLLHAVPWKDFVLVAFVVGGSSLLAVVLWATDSNILAGIAFLSVLTVLLITFYRVDWGFYLFIFMVFLFDQFGVPGFSSITSQVGYFLNLSTISYLPKMEEGAVTPMELHLVLLFSVWVLVVSLRKQIHLTRVPLKLPILLLFLAVVGAVVHGQATGGDLIISLWEVRGLFYLGFFFFFAPQIIQTKRQLETLFWFCIAGISIKAFQGAERYASLGFSFGYWPNIYETLTNHEDPVFFITLFVLLIGLVLFGSHPKQRRALQWLLLPLIVGYIAAQRRATYASFIASLVAFIVLIPKEERQRFLRVSMMILFVFGLYVGAFWDSHSKAGVVAQQVRATFTGEGNIRGEKDYASSLYRDQENYNLAITVQSTPIIGIGFGKPFQLAVRLWSIDINKLGMYIPHNQILWIFVKMGVVGGFLFWLFFNSFVFRGAMVFSRLADPYLKAVCALCVVAVINQLVVSYVDMQLTWYRNMVYLGTLMGLVPALEKMDEASRVTSQNNTQSPSLVQ